MKKVVALTVGLLVAFGLGYVPQYLKSNRLAAEMQQSQERFQQQLAEVESRNKILMLHSELGMLLLEVENQNYGNARERSTAWFDHLRGVISGSTDQSTVKALNSIMGQRDTLTALLTEAKPEALTMVREMYRSMAAVVGVK